MNILGTNNSPSTHQTVKFFLNSIVSQHTGFINGLKKIVKITNCAFLFPKMQLFNLSLNFANVKGLLKDYKIIILN